MTTTISVLSTTPADPLPEIGSALSAEFKENAAAAMLVLLTCFSGGTGKPFSSAIVAESCEGKSFLVNRITAIFRESQKRLVSTSRISLPALFALGKVDIIVEDELIRDYGYESVRRQLITFGEASRHLSTSTGELREEILRGNVAFISTQLESTHDEFQNSNRLIRIALSKSEKQTLFHATRVLNDYGNRSAGEGNWDATVARIRKLINATPPGIDVRFRNEDVEELLPPVLPPHFPRRLKQVMRVAWHIAVLRRHSTLASARSELIAGEWSDIRTALQILMAAHVMDDSATLEERDRAFLQLIATLGFIDQQTAIPLGNIVDRLNHGNYRGAAVHQVDTAKMRGEAARRDPRWTRGIVKRRLDRLFDAGLLTMASRKAYRLTPFGQAYAKTGGHNCFLQIFRAFQPEEG